MSESTVTKSKIFYEDVNFATGGTGAAETGVRRTSVGGYVTLTKIDASHIKYRNVSTSIESSATSAHLCLTEAEITAAITAIGSDAGSIKLIAAITLTDNLTIPSNVKLIQEYGAILTIPTAKTLTINSPFDPGLYQVFSGTGKVVFGTGSVNRFILEWWGTNAAAMQLAIDCAAASTCKRINLSGASYTFSTPINVTSTASVDRSNIVVQGLGKRGGTTIYANTGNILFELTGSAHTSWRDFYIEHGATTPSTVAFFLAGTAAKPECLYHNFDVMISLYMADITGYTYGSIGYLVVGAEENTWDKTQTYATTPFLFSSVYSIVSAEYPSYFLPAAIQASHSCGVNTFSGENQLITWDSKGPNLVLYGTNSLGLGNMYMGNVNAGTPGSVVSGIKMEGGTLEGLRGKIKIEGKSTLLDMTGGETWGWDLAVQYGACADATVANPVVLIHADHGAEVNLQHFKLKVSYWDVDAVSFAGKKIFDTTGTPNITPVLSNIEVSVNQTQAEYNTTPFPAWFCGLTRHFTLKWRDAKYYMDANRHVLTLAAYRIYIGQGDAATPVNVAKIYLPTITANFSSRTIGVRFKGMLTAMNTNGGGAEDDICSCLFDTSKGAWSIKDGAITVGGSPSDNLLPVTTVTALSSNGVEYLFTGVNMGMTYSALARTIQLDALQLASGTNLAKTLAFIHSGEIEMFTVGRLQELTYLW